VVTSAVERSASRLRRQVRKLPRIGRYARPVLRHGTPKKLANILRVESEMRQQKTTLRGYPYYYLIDVCNVCNLRCPLCPTGYEALGRTQGLMSFAEYKRILDKVKPYALVTSLYNHGEPFLNKDIFSIIDYTSRSNIATNVSSNFNWPVKFDPRDIVRSGLEYLTISLDGTSQETYQQYRVRGDFKEVIENIKAVVAARKELKSRTPFLEWQFIVFKHNEHEQERAKELAAELGVDLLRFTSPGVPPELMGDRVLSEKWMPENPTYWELNPKIVDSQGYLFDQTCFYLYRSMTFYPGGGVSPCCFTHDKNHDFGNILESELDEIWNNERFRSARMLFSKKKSEEQRVEVICDVCPIFKQEGGHACAGHCA
jgi:radical SAM protein with 4Fe4S-binding SPASM domain